MIKKIHSRTKILLWIFLHYFLLFWQKNCHFRSMG